MNNCWYIWEGCVHMQMIGSIKEQGVNDKKCIKMGRNIRYI